MYEIAIEVSRRTTNVSTAWDPCPLEVRGRERSERKISRHVGVFSSHVKL